MGFWVRGQHELLLIATRGDIPTPPEAARPPSVFRSPRGKHSAKPPEVRAVIEAMYTALPKMELFARGEAPPGWTFWGNQASVPPALKDTVERSLP